MIFKKKNKIDFFSKIPGVAETFPIIPTSKFKPKWVEACKNDFIRNKGSKQPSHLQLCPGIFEVYKYGYVVPMWHDVTIKTFRDREDFEAGTPSKHLNEMYNGEVVGTHPYEITKWLPKRPYSKHAFVKLNTPWHVIAPPGVKFLVIPIPYADNYDYESAIGILDPSVSTEVNIQAYWNVNEGERKIFAGTPMMQLVPISEKSFDLDVRDATEHDKIWLDKRTYIYIFGYKVDKAKMKEAYLKHFGGKK